MSEENKSASKNKWSRIFRKKWFFPALYLTIAALLVSSVVWYQSLDNQTADTGEEQEEEQTNTEHPNEEATPVLDPQEVIEMPVSNQDQAEIVTKFYDHSAEQEDQEAALVLYNNRYYQSTGVDIAGSEGESFDVTASLSGTVSEVKEDPLLGNVVVLSHDSDVMTYYASLGEVAVQAGDEVSQGDQLGTAGKNLFGQDSGTHVHFELRKDGQEVNPETFFNQPVSSLDSVTEEVTDESEATETEEAEGTEQTEESDVIDDFGGIGEPEESGNPEDDGNAEEDGSTADMEDENPEEDENLEEE